MLRWTAHLDGAGGWNTASADRVGQPNRDSIDTNLHTAAACFTVVHTQRDHTVGQQLHYVGFLHALGVAAGGACGDSDGAV